MALRSNCSGGDLHPVQPGSLPDRTLADGEGVLGHGVTHRQGAFREAVGGELIEEDAVALGVSRLGAVDGGAPAAEVDAFQVTGAHGARQVVVGEVGQPAQRTLVFVDGLQQDLGIRGSSGRETSASTSGVPVTMGMTKPAIRPISWYSGSQLTTMSSVTKLDGLAIGLDLVEHGAVGERHAFLQAGGAAAVLQESDLFVDRGSARRRRRSAWPFPCGTSSALSTPAVGARPAARSVRP